MKETADQSAELKQQFKMWFAHHGYYAPLPSDLQEEADQFPLEWSEACQEWEADHA